MKSLERKAMWRAHLTRHYVCRHLTSLARITTTINSKSDGNRTLSSAASLTDSAYFGAALTMPHLAPRAT